MVVLCSENSSAATLPRRRLPAAFNFVQKRRDCGPLLCRGAHGIRDEKAHIAMCSLRAAPQSAAATTRLLFPDPEPIIRPGLHHEAGSSVKQRRRVDLTTQFSSLVYTRAKDILVYNELKREVLHVKRVVQNHYHAQTRNVLPFPRCRVAVEPASARSRVEENAPSANAWSRVHERHYLTAM
jgi:hypothetical protein